MNVKQVMELFQEKLDSGEISETDSVHFFQPEELPKEKMVEVDEIYRITYLQGCIYLDGEAHDTN